MVKKLCQIKTGKISINHTYLQIESLEQGIVLCFTRITVRKKTHLADFETCVFLRISPEPIELQNIFLHLFTSLSEQLSDKKK